MDKLCDMLTETLDKATALKTGERNEEQRQLSILITDLEKIVAWAEYITIKPPIG